MKKRINRILIIAAWAWCMLFGGALLHTQAAAYELDCSADNGGLVSCTKPQDLGGELWECIDPSRRGQADQYVVLREHPANSCFSEQWAAFVNHGTISSSIISIAAVWGGILGLGAGLYVLTMYIYRRSGILEDRFPTPVPATPAAVADDSARIKAIRRGYAIRAAVAKSKAARAAGNNIVVGAGGKNYLTPGHSWGFRGGVECRAYRRDSFAG